jgi:hygromycin-B 7''-O-kinase
MSNSPGLAGLPAAGDPRAFDALHDDAPAWRGVIESIAREHAGADVPVRQALEGTALVALVGRERVIKLYPPFLRDHFEFECALPTPALLATGERDGWPYSVITQLAGEPLPATWPQMTESRRLALLRTLGALTVEVHALPVGRIAALAPRWADFIAAQRERCLGRQQRTGLPEHLLAQVPKFIAGPLPECEAVLLTGEYTPMNLFTIDGRLAAMYDFGDGLVGPREYDWLGPLCFLAAGSAERCAAFMGGVGVELTEALRSRLMRLMLLHRYSHLRAQLRIIGWETARDFEDLAERAWPLA